MIRLSANDNDLILDFFAGSCTTAQAALELNRDDTTNHRFIMVQLPKPTPKGSNARHAGYRTIADIGKERIRRVIAKMQRERKGLLSGIGETPENLGFKVFKLAPSNIQPWRGVDERTPAAYAQQMELFQDPLVESWQAEAVIYEIALKEGYSLNCRIAPISPTPQMGGQGPELRVYRVTDPNSEQSFAICLADRITLADLHGLNFSEDDTFICRDAALDDEAAANLALQCELKTI
jgi:adenine-specific DNA-methyltransferase